MLKFFKTYLIQFLIVIIFFLFVFLGVSYFQENSLKNELKSKKHEVLELKTQILLLKKNNKIAIANTVNTEDANKTIEEIIKLQEKERDEELAAHNYTNNSNNILNGMFIMHPSN